MIEDEITWPRKTSVRLPAPLQAEAVLSGGKGDAGEGVAVDDHVASAFLDAKGTSVQLSRNSHAKAL